MISALFLIAAFTASAGALWSFTQARNPAYRGAVAYRKHRNRMTWLTIILLVLAHALSFEAGVRAFGC